MKRRFRITRSTDFERVRRGKSFAHPLIVLITRPNQLDHPRFGFSASKSVGNAVRRNRAKRLLRAAAQKQLLEVEPGYDILIIARKPIVGASFEAVQNALNELVIRAGLRRNT